VPVAQVVANHLAERHEREIEALHEAEQTENDTDETAEHLSGIAERATVEEDGAKEHEVGDNRHNGDNLRHERDNGIDQRRLALGQREESRGKRFETAREARARELLELSVHGGQIGHIIIISIVMGNDDMRNRIIGSSGCD
jgi:hypothetical protein